MSEPEKTTMSSWPELPYEAWEPTKQTLHRYTQIVGKVRMALVPPRNHWWHVTLYVTERGLSTGPMPYGGGGAGSSPAGCAELLRTAEERACESHRLRVVVASRTPTMMSAAVAGTTFRPTRSYTTLRDVTRERADDRQIPRTPRAAVQHRPEALLQKRTVRACAQACCTVYHGLVTARPPTNSAGRRATARSR
jgi:hypothetical protein